MIERKLEWYNIYYRFNKNAKIQTHEVLAVTKEQAFRRLKDQINQNIIIKGFKTRSLN